MKTALRNLCVLWLGLCCASCQPKPPPPIAPSAVQHGQLYQSGQSEFDVLFRETHDLQAQLRSAVEDERTIRKSLAASLAIEDGATRQVISAAVSTRVAALSAKKTRVKLDVEGLDADDDADTMAQARVLGTLDDATQKFVEAVALAARQELRFAARLRHSQKRLEYLAHHAAALEPWVEPTFAGQGPSKVAEVRHNLDDARRQYPLLTVRAAELSSDARRTAQALAHALTTDPSLNGNKELPLVAPIEPASPPPKKPHTANAPVAPKKPAAAATGKAGERGAADFEP